MTELSRRLRVLRAERRLSQRALARRASLSEWRYWNIENGYQQPTEQELRRLARAFRLPRHVAFPEVTT